MNSFDLDEAIRVHRAWKMKFHLALGSVQDRDFDTAPIGDSGQCGLGRWLSANAEALAGSVVVAELHGVHDEFHRQSQAIADAIRDGRILSMDDPAIAAYLVLSRRVEDLLYRLKDELKPAA